MSTENEGAAVGPEGKPPTASPTPESASASGAPGPASGAPAAHPEAATAVSPAVAADAEQAGEPAVRPTTAQTPSAAPSAAPPPPDFAPAVGGPAPSGAAQAPAPQEPPAAGGSPQTQQPPAGPSYPGEPQPGHGGPAAGQSAGHGQSGVPGQSGAHGQGWGYGPGDTAAQPPYAAHGATGGGWAGQAPPPYNSGPGDVWGAPVPPEPRRRRGGGLIAAVLVAALVGGGIGAGAIYAFGRDDSGSTTVSAAGNPEALNRKPTSVAGIAQKALPSVVTIEAQGAGGDGGTGTGFVYDKQGHILTNNHVVATAANGGRLMATFSNGKKYAAEVVGRAQGYDVAVIKLKNPSDAHLAPLPLGKSSDVQVGDATIAIGAPFGLSGTVTTGIISAKNRPVASSDGAGSGNSYMSALQTDASINPGNSGGPLMDAAGNVIGINSAIQSAGNGGGFGGGAQQSGSIGLGFAIPIDQAKRVAQDLIKTGQPVYPQIGVQVGMRDAGSGATIAQSGNNGSAAVTPDGPADKAGLKPGDTITKLDNTVIDSGPTLISEIWQHRPGDKVTLTYKRSGKEHTTQVTLGQRTGES